MVVSRSALTRGLVAARAARQIRPAALRKGLQPVLRRGYASGGDAHAASSDLPWLLGAVAVTVPSVYYLWPESAHGDAHHGHGDHEADEESHEEEGEAKEEPQEESSDDQSTDESADQSEEASGGEDTDKTSDDEPSDSERSESSEEPDSGSEGSKKPEGEAVKTSNKKVDGVQFKGKTSAGDENNEMHDFRKREPDSKGAFKKRIDSAYQKNLGEGPHYDDKGNPTLEGLSAAAPSGKAGAIDTKQAGLSTTPTRHSTQIDQDPEKSKKPNGAPETAKSATTINPHHGK